MKDVLPWVSCLFSCRASQSFTVLHFSVQNVVAPNAFFFCRVDAQSISASSKRDQASVFHGSFLATHLLAWKALRIVCFLAAGHPPSWFWVGWWVESQGSDRVQNDYLGWDQEFSVLFPLSRVSTWTISDGPGAAFVSDFSFSHC